MKAECSSLARTSLSFYQQRLDEKGQPDIDVHGIALLNCNRGTNITECIHKQIITTFGTWCTGVEMSDKLMAERRHRYNQHVSERRRLGFPKLGHSDTWLIDSLQLLVERVARHDTREGVNRARLNNVRGDGVKLVDVRRDALDVLRAGSPAPAHRWPLP